MARLDWGQSGGAGGKVALPNGLSIAHPTDPISRLNIRYNTQYIPGLQKSGNYNAGLASHVYSYDLSRLKHGQNPLSEAEFINAYHSLAKGVPLTAPKPSGGGGIGGFLNNIKNDVAGLVSGMNPVNLVPTIANEAGATLDLALHPGKYGAQVHSLEDVLGLPGIRDVPGVYTARNVVGGHWQNIYEHPVSTTLDVLPAASEATKLLAPEEAAAVGTTAEAMQEGKPLKAVSRATGLSDVMGSVAKKLGVSADIRNLSRIREVIRQGDVVTNVAKSAFEKMTESQQAVADHLDVIKQEGQTTEHLDKLSRLNHKYIVDRAKFIRAANVEWMAHFTAYSQSAEDVLRGIANELGVDIVPGGKDGIDIGLQPGTRATKVTGPTHLKSRVMNEFNDRYVTMKKLARSWGVSGKNLKALETEVGVPLDSVVIPKYIDNAFNLLREGEKNTLLKGLEKTTDVFRYSVVTRPQHYLHILATSIMATVLEHGIAPFQYFNEARDMIRNPDHWPLGVDKKLFFSSDVNKANAILSNAQGGFLAKLWKASHIGNAAQAFRHFEEVTSNMFTAMNYLYGESKGLTDAEIRRIGPTYQTWHQTLSPEHLGGLEAVRKTMLDINGMSPVERTIIRNIVPFYAYERWLLRFLTRFPADHPFRAAFLASMGRLQEQEFAQNLPTKFMDILPLGSMDSKGNVSTIDTKNLNPFRSLNGYNPFTLAGFLSALNPALTAPFQAAGLNITTATPDLYPNLTVDPRTGALVATHPDLLPSLIESILPPTQAIDEAIGISSRYKTLKEKGGAAYTKAIFSALGVPFLPVTYNMPEEEIKYAHNQFLSAGAEARNALKSGSASADTFTKLPVRGEFLTQSQLQSLLDQLKLVKKQQGTKARLTDYLSR